MKNLIFILCFSLVVVCAGNVSAQTKQQSPAPAKTSVTTSEQSKNVAATPAPAVLSESAGPTVQVDAEGKTFTIVEGRKVYVDGNGVQSLAAPAEKNAETVPLKESASQPEK